MIEQVIAGVVGGFCGWLAWVVFMTISILSAKKLGKNIKNNPTVLYFFASITGAYLFIQWFC